MENVTQKPKRAFKLLCASVAILSFIQFLLFYIPNGFFYENDLLLISASYLANFFEAFFPVAAALIIFLSRDSGLKNKILPCIYVTLTRLFYSIPYYYIYYVSDVFNSQEAILLAFLISLVFLSFFFLQTFICIIITNCVENRVPIKNRTRKPAKLFDLDDHLNFATVLSVLFIFVVYFAKECINTVQYIIDADGTYRTEEILSIVFSFLVLFIFSIVHYLLCTQIKNKVL